MRETKLDSNIGLSEKKNLVAERFSNGEGNGDSLDVHLDSDVVPRVNDTTLTNGMKWNNLESEPDKINLVTNSIHDLETDKAYIDKHHLSDDKSNATSNELKNTTCEVPKQSEVEIPLLKHEECKDSIKDKLNFDNDSNSAVPDESKTSRNSQSEKRTVSDGNDKNRLKKSISRTQSCLEDPPDGGWGWVVTFSAFMVGLILDGISFSFGLFFKELYLYFNESKSITSWIISVLNGTYLGIGPVASILVSIFGCRKVAIFGALMASIAFFLCTWSPNVQVMILLYGLIGGAGLGLLYLPSIVTVGHYFKKKRALATGIAVCGSGIGGFVFAPLSQFLIEMYTWKGAMWVISAITLNGIVVAALLRPIEKTSSKKNTSYSEKEKYEQKEKLLNSACESEDNSEKQKCCDVSNMFDFSLLKSLTFLVYGCSCFLCMLVQGLSFFALYGSVTLTLSGFIAMKFSSGMVALNIYANGFFIPFTYIPDLAEDYGMTPQQSALLISIIGILNTVARVLVGWVADRPWADALILNSVALVVGGVSTMFVPYYGNFGVMATYSVVFGVAIAVFVSLRSIIMAELLGIEKLTSSFGLVTMCQGLSAFIGAPIAGALSDITGNYKGAFYLAGAAICLSGLICFPLRRISKWEYRRKDKDGLNFSPNAIVLSSDLTIHVSSKQNVNV